MDPNRDPLPRPIPYPSREQYEEIMAVVNARRPAPPVPASVTLDSVLALAIPHPPGTPVPTNPQEFCDSLVAAIKNGVKKRQEQAEMLLAAARQQGAAVSGPNNVMSWVQVPPQRMAMQPHYNSVQQAPQQVSSRKSRGNGNSGRRNAQSTPAQVNRYVPYSVSYPNLPPMNSTPFWIPPRNDNLQVHPLLDTSPIPEWITNKSIAELMEILKARQRNAQTTRNPVQALNLSVPPLAQAAQHAYHMQLEALMPSSSAFVPYGLMRIHPIVSVQNSGVDTSFVNLLSSISQVGQVPPSAQNGNGFSSQTKKEDN